MLYEETHDNQYKSEVEGFVRDYMPGGSVAYTPCGMAWRDKWGSNRYAGTSVCLSVGLGVGRGYSDTPVRLCVCQSVLGWGGGTYTPCGVAFRDKWGSNRYAGTSKCLSVCLLVGRGYIHPLWCGLARQVWFQQIRRYVSVLANIGEGREYTPCSMTRQDEWRRWYVSVFVCLRMRGVSEKGRGAKTPCGMSP